MSVETAPLQGITLYSHADDFRSHWIRYVLAEKQIKYHLIMVDEDDEDLASLNPYNQLPMLIENELKLFNTGIISMIVTVKINCMPMHQCKKQNKNNTFGASNKTG